MNKTDNKLPDTMNFLDRNENNYGPAPACLSAINNLHFTQLSWYSRDFNRGIKGELSLRLARDFGLDEDRVVIGYGGEDILKQVVHCYLRKDEKIMIPTYSWWYYKSIADEMRGEMLEYQLFPEGESFHYDVEGMLQMYKEHKPRLILISSPNNPTGNSILMDDLRRILTAAKDSIVVLDEAYAMFKNPDLSYPKDLVDEFDNLLIIRTFSKYYALAGVRIGFGLMGRGLTSFMKFSARYLGYNRITEEIALAALNSPEYYQDISRKMAADADMLFKELNQLTGFKAYRTDANFLLVEIPSEIKTTMKEFLLARKLQIKFMNEVRLNSHLRITIGTQEQNKNLIAAIKEFLNT